MTTLDPQWTDLARGAALGVAVAAPIGPTALLCIQRTLACGRLEGMATGYGAATTHTAYAATAAAGLAVVERTAADWQGLLQFCCAAFLLRMAVQTMRRRPILHGAPSPRVRPWRAYATGLAWTLGNPMTLLGFATLTPGILGDGTRPWQSLPLLAGGVLLGSAAWWTALTVVVASARRRLSARGLRLANLATGAALVVFAILVLARAAGLAHADAVVAGHTHEAAAASCPAQLGQVPHEWADRDLASGPLAPAQCSSCGRR